MKPYNAPKCIIDNVRELWPQGENDDESSDQYLSRLLYFWFKIHLIRLQVCLQQMIML